MLKELLYNTSKESFEPILNKILELLDSEYQGLAINLLLTCSTFKNGARIRDWSQLCSRLLAILRSSGMQTKEMYLLIATIVAKADTITSKSLTKAVFEVITKENSRKVGVFCELVGKLDQSTFQNFVHEEYWKYVNQATEKDFEGIALTIVALKQQGLLHPRHSLGDVNGRLNGTISKKSKFARWLQSRLGPEHGGDSLTVWRDLQVVEILGLWSPEIKRWINDTLLEVSSANSGSRVNVVGSSLSLLAYHESLELEEIISSLMSQLERLRTDLGFLEGLEKLLKNNSRYFFRFMSRY